MKMYSTSRDTRQCISNNKVIIQQVVMEWNRKINEISTKMKGWVNHTHGMWITHLNFAVYVFYIAQIQDQDEKRLIFNFILYRWDFEKIIAYELRFC